MTNKFHGQSDRRTTNKMWSELLAQVSQKRNQGYFDWLLHVHKDVGLARNNGKFWFVHNDLKWISNMIGFNHWDDSPWKKSLYWLLLLYYCHLLLHHFHLLYHFHLLHYSVSPVKSKHHQIFKHLSSNKLVIMMAMIKIIMEERVFNQATPFLECRLSFKWYHLSNSSFSSGPMSLRWTFISCYCF